jgi:hypothetical protein
MTHSAKREALMEIANLIVQHSDGRASLAFKEDDKTTEKVEDAAHFIKVDGKRICRDIEMYSFMGDELDEWGRVLAMFLEEVLLSVKGFGLTKSYTAASEKLKELGHEVYPAELHAEWDGLF